MALSIRLARRLLTLVALLLAVSAATYLAIVTTTTPSTARVYTVSEEPARPALEVALGQYVEYLGDAARGDLGHTRRNEPVAALLGRTFFKSLGLLGLALAIATSLGVGAALVGHARKERAARAVPIAFSVGLLAMPSFLIGGLCQAINVEIAVGLGIPALPTIGAGWDLHLVMPAFVLAARPAAYVARVTTRLLAETDRELFVRTARAKGLSEWAVLARHILRAAAPGVIAAVALALRLAVGTLPIVEIVFVYPGMGMSFLAALRGGDVEATTGLAVAIALTLWVLALGFDVARRWVDPRLATQAAGGAA